MYKQDPSNNSTNSLVDDQAVPPSPPTLDKHGNHGAVQTSISNIFKPSDQRTKRATVDNGKNMT